MPGRKLSGNRRCFRYSGFGEFPDVGGHVVAGDHPECVVVVKEGAGVAHGPGGVGDFVPVDAVGGVPYVFAVVAIYVVALHDPEAVVEGGDIVILAGVPGGGFEFTGPVGAVGGGPDVVEEFSGGDFGGVVGSAAEEVDFVVEDGVSADHAARAPGEVIGFFFPLLAVGAGPCVGEEDFTFGAGGEVGEGLAAEDPELAFEGNGVVQDALFEGDIVVDAGPVFAVGAGPDVVLVMALVTVAADDVHEAVVDGIAGGVSAFPGGFFDVKFPVFAVG